MGYEEEAVVSASKDILHLTEHAKYAGWGSGALRQKPLAVSGTI